MHSAPAAALALHHAYPLLCLCPPVPPPGLDPVDVLLLMAASENDLPKVEELLLAGARVDIADSNGKSPLQLASKPEVVAALQAKVSA